MCSNPRATTPEPNHFGYITIPPNIYANPYVAPFRAPYQTAPRYPRDVINRKTAYKKPRKTIDSETYQTKPVRNSYVSSKDAYASPKKYDENGCYDTGDGHKCCNSDLEQTIHDSYDCLMAQSGFQTCAI
uniref:Capsid protein n=1 Tax=Panagrolaimus sp. JU765 TaxID=591449 RepID=A0AC34QF66_9BILA